MCKSVTVECSKELTSYCFISVPSIQLLEEDTVYIIKPDQYWRSVDTILEIRPQKRSFIASIDSCFDHFPNLEQLFISNSLNELPSMRHTAKTLRLISFRNNFISEIKSSAFYGSPNLEDIDLSSNKIHTIENYSFNRLERLVSIRLENNKLGSLQRHPFAGADSLKYINLRNNSITTIANECFALKSLEELNLAQNKIEMLPDLQFDGAERLKKVTLAHNNIKVMNLIPLLKSTPIETISFEGNHLGMFEKQTIDCTTEKNLHLKHLTLTRNQLKSEFIFERLKCLENLETPNLNTNEFTYFQNIQELRVYFLHLSIIQMIGNRIECNWLRQTAFDTSLIYTRSMGKFSVNGIECT